MTVSSIPRQCDCCGRTRITTLANFRQNVSFFFGRRERVFSGKICFVCMTKEFLKFETTTLFGTWWGLIGCLLGPVYLLYNLLEYASGSFLIARDKVRR
jgi:hypothetical protein